MKKEDGEPKDKSKEIKPKPKKEKVKSVSEFFGG